MKYVFVFHSKSAKAFTLKKYSLHRIKQDCSVSQDIVTIQASQLATVEANEAVTSKPKLSPCLHATTS